ncbi:hypothetical protein [Xanthomonas phage X1]|nr:hypothetical protein [Xanthomonas phage X1]
MNHLFVYQPYSVWPFRGKAFMLRQGLEPVIDPTISVVWNGYNSEYRPLMKLAPDQTKGVYSHSNTTANVHRYFDVTTTGLNPTNATAAFAGFINDSFAGQDYYGWVGSTSSFINAFRWSDHSLITLVKTGLGEVYSCSLHPNGYHLAVTHGTTPFLRLYDLRDGSYVDAASAHLNYSTCKWTPDGTALVSVSSSSPYVSKWNPSITTRTSISTSSAYSHSSSYVGGYQYGYGAVKGIDHWTKPGAVLMSVCSLGNAPYLFEVDTVTNTITNVPSGNTEYLYWAAYDSKFNKLYTYQGTNGYTTVQNFRRFNGTTYVEEPMVSAPQSLVSSSSTGTSCALMIVSAKTGTITGTVRDVNNNPAARKIRAYRRSDGLLVAETTSDGTTGNYTIITPTSDTEAYDVQFVTNNGELLNDLFYARTTPAAVA